MRRRVAQGLPILHDTSKQTDWGVMLAELTQVDGVEIDLETYKMSFEWGNIGLIYRTDMIVDDQTSLQMLANLAVQGEASIPYAASGKNIIKSWG